jgi:hypothetical protein
MKKLFLILCTVFSLFAFGCSGGGGGGGNGGGGGGGEGESLPSIADAFPDPATLGLGSTEPSTKLTRTIKTNEYHVRGMDVINAYFFDVLMEPPVEEDFDCVITPKLFCTHKASGATVEYDVTYYQTYTYHYLYQTIELDAGDSDVDFSIYPEIAETDGSISMDHIAKIYSGITTAEYQYFTAYANALTNGYGFALVPGTAGTYCKDLDNNYGACYQLLYVPMAGALTFTRYTISYDDYF